MPEVQVYPQASVPLWVLGHAGDQAPLDHVWWQVDPADQVELVGFAGEQATSLVSETHDPPS